MNRRSLATHGLALGFAVFLVNAGWQLANAETPQPVSSAETQTSAVEPDPARTEVERQVPPATPRKADARPTRPAATSKAAKNPLEQLQSQIREAQREREEAAQEHQLLKARLAEMEKKIQELMQQNAERDARLRAQASPVK